MSLGEMPLVQVKALGKMYTRRPRDMRRKLGNVSQFLQAADFGLCRI